MPNKKQTRDRLINAYTQPISSHGEIPFEEGAPFILCSCKRCGSTSITVKMEQLFKMGFHASDGVAAFCHQRSATPTLIICDCCNFSAMDDVFLLDAVRKWNKADEEKNYHPLRSTLSATYCITPLKIETWEIVDAKDKAQI